VGNTLIENYKPEDEGRGIVLGPPSSGRRPRSRTSPRTTTTRWRADDADQDPLRAAAAGSSDLHGRAYDRGRR
jgi:hypothetical protein